MEDVKSMINYLFYRHHKRISPFKWTSLFSNKKGKPKLKIQSDLRIFSYVALKIQIASNNSSFCPSPFRVHFELKYHKIELWNKEIFNENAKSDKNYLSLCRNMSW